MSTPPDHCAAQIFFAAAGLEGEARREMIARECAGDEELRREVESFLEPAAGSEEYFADLANRLGVRALLRDELAADTAHAPASQTGAGSRPATGPGGTTASATTEDRLGPYRLLERIGRGGMGEVYRAERVDGQYVQIAAIKVIRAGFVTPEIRQRIRSERQILAHLEHPNIARLLDGSVAPDGSPYLVMEYIEGRSITAFCDSERLSLEQRLKLFRTVCRAVGHAHRNLIVHRDLKPSNILVTAAGEVKLLDFGIAKLLTPTGEAGIELTQTLAPLMTPGYASPEQIRGEAITTATDVYGLGLLLYELLCGRRGQHAEDGSFAALERAVCEEEPPRPSDALRLGSPEGVAARVAARRGVRLARLRKQIRGDLDTIVTAALRKDPARRYAAAQQLGEDIDRHLAGQPVIARPDTFGYRTGKFLRRHRLGVAASAAIALSLVVGLALSLLSLARAQRAELWALDEAAASGQISEFLVDLFRANDPAEARGDTVTARELLDRGSSRIEERLADQPAVEARLLRSMGEAYKALGLYDSALDLVGRELDLVRATRGEESTEVGRALIELGDLQALNGDYEGSRTSVERALTLLQRDAGPESVDMASALAQLGRARAQLGDMAAAATALERAIEIIERTSGRDHVRLWRPLNNLAHVRRVLGHGPVAHDLFRRALDIVERELGPEHPSVVQILNNLAISQGEAGDLEAAIATHERALVIREKILPPDHPHIATTLSNLSSVLTTQGDFVRAKELSERALGIRERALGLEHPHVASTRTNLGFALLGLGDRDAARPLFESSVSAFERALGAEHINVSVPLLGLASIHAATGDAEAAEQAFERTFEIREAQLESHHPDLMEVLEEYAAFLRGRGRISEADALERRRGGPGPQAN